MSDSVRHGDVEGRREDFVHEPRNRYVVESGGRSGLDGSDAVEGSLETPRALRGGYLSEISGAERVFEHRLLHRKAEVDCERLREDRNRIRLRERLSGLLHRLLRDEERTECAVVRIDRGRVDDSHLLDSGVCRVGTKLDNCDARGSVREGVSVCSKVRSRGRRLGLESVGNSEASGRVERSTSPSEVASEKIHYTTAQVQRLSTSELASDRHAIASGGRAGVFVPPDSNEDDEPLLKEGRLRVHLVGGLSGLRPEVDEGSLLLVDELRVRLSVRERSVEREAVRVEGGRHLREFGRSEPGRTGREVSGRVELSESSARGGAASVRSCR